MDHLNESFLQLSMQLQSRAQASRWENERETSAEKHSEVIIEYYTLHNPKSNLRANCLVKSFEMVSGILFATNPHTSRCIITPLSLITSLSYRK